MRRGGVCISWRPSLKGQSLYLRTTAPIASGTILMYRARPALFSLLVACTLAAAAEPSPDVLKDPARDTFVILPLHVHVLSCPDRDDLDCKLTDDDVKRVIGKVNGVWHKA